MEFKLGEVSKFYDSLHKTPKDYNIYGYPMVRVKDISTGFLDLSSCFNVSEDDYLEFSKKYKPQSGDIIITRVGTYGNIALVTDDTKFCLGQNTVILNVDKKMIDNKYLFYYLTSPKGQQQIESRVTGSTQKTISLKSLKEINIIRHDYYKEKQIGNLLYKIDNKINNNRQIVANLEDLSETLFKRWFVDFEFLDENGNPYKSSGGEMIDSELGEIPEGWSLGNFENLGKIVGGGTPSKKVSEYYTKQKEIPWITPKDLSKNKNTYIYHGEQDITELGLNKSSAKLINKDSVLFSSRAPIGYIAIAGQEVTTNQGFKSIEVNKNINPYYVFFLLKYKLPIIEQTASGSTFKEISSKVMKSIPIILPIIETINKYGNIVESYFEKIKILEKENQKLIQLRDTLLPKLMSGEIEIPDDIEVNEDELSI
ncbi:restriction endonuclease subunit S [Staphylococcus warneri]|uniref:restriction endonuclease subunit S n=1 Tax=Staphylococcus warneri TaxID=1292 RepID=UPI002928D3C3|nr:restriction endonuclease subunit S [Staphylococcus warneri]MDU9351966.1 restriction endonuclease subunit S [Staphylococcus warneri]